MQGYTNGKQFITIPEWILCDAKLELADWSPREDHKILSVEFKQPVLTSQIKTLIGAQIEYIDNTYQILGAEFYSVADDREYDTINLLVKEV